MNWDNETVLTFLELYQMNNCIWDPQNEFHKKRENVNDAWNNIKENLGMPCTVKDLKRKKESLMSAYRGYKHKIKKSERERGEVYRPTWFAFGLMDSFLGSVYTCPSPSHSNTEGEENEDMINISITPEIDENYPQEYTTQPSTSSPSPHYSSTPAASKRKQHNSPDLSHAKHQMDHAFNFMRNVYHQSKDDDECSIFGLLIAKKLRRLSEERRDVMMVKINQLFIDERYDINRPNTNSTMYTPSPPPQSFQVPSPLSYDEKTAMIKPKLEIDTEYIVPSTAVESSSSNHDEKAFLLPNTIKGVPRLCHTEKKYLKHCK